MKKKIVVLLLPMVIALGWICSSASADIMTYSAELPITSYGYGSPNKLDGFGDYAAWSQDFSSLGFSQILNPVITLDLADDQHDPRWAPDELAMFIGGGVGELFEVNNDLYSINLPPDSLLDGKFTGILASLGGDFHLNSAALSFDYSKPSNPSPVPEPASVILLGSGLVGLVGLRIRKRKKTSTKV